MATHKATVTWQANGGDLPAKRYSRAHQWIFDGGVTVPASSSPHVVPLPWSDAHAVDPEEALIAAAASCHMLSFLWAAAKDGFSIQSYRDEAEGVLAKNQHGRLAITRITLRPRIVFTDRQPTAGELQALHHTAHEECYIANSLLTEIVVEAPIGES
ncbi:MAG: OsmC family peroxiredoxin [Rhodospirillaceae bacterium]|nr:MAG: OsmC family peroxiredoxin [Rhodospirillaceae bacterium]